VKVGRCEVAQISFRSADRKPVARNTTEPRFCPHLADSAQNFQNVVVPLHFGPDRFRLAGVIPERLICSDPQSHYNVMYGLGLSA